MNPPGLVWDSCALINLAATGRAAEILALFDCPSCVVRQVLASEVLFLRPLPEEDPDAGLIAADLRPLLESGLLQEVDLSPEEQLTQVAFAARLDDGEAMSAAVAASRGLWLVTDDRPAIRLARSLPSPIAVLTTPEWVKFWMETAGIPRAILASALRGVRIRARYRPRPTDPLRPWWDEHLSPESQT